VSTGPSELGSVPGPKVFITYRREETAAHAGRIYDAMVARFGEGHVFMDVDMTPGVDFVERITEAVAACQVLIVVMGPRWATVENEQGTARIADPDDFVRLEVETALRRPEVTPIPVLVSGARMPSRELLPPEVQAITRRNALELSDSRWRYDIGRLIGTLDELLAQTPLVDRPSPERRVGAETAAPADAAQPSGETAPPPLPDAATTAGETKRTAPRWGGRRRRWLLLAAIAIAAVAAAVVVAVLLRSSIPEGEFRGRGLSDLVLVDPPAGNLKTESRAGYPDGVPELAGEDPEGAYYKEFTQLNDDATPYEHSLSAAAVFKDEVVAAEALDNIRATFQAADIQEGPVPDLGEQGGYVFRVKDDEFRYAWQTGKLLQYFDLVWVEGPASEETALRFAEKMEALVPAAP
jgi:hypothetical protein